MKKLVFVYLLLPLLSFAQLQNATEIEVLGNPSWNMEVSLADKGMIVLIKTDVTKINIYRFDSDLKQQWVKEYFLDAEKAPKAYTIANDHVSFLFSESNGMYYQVFEIDLESGKLVQNGFELRDFFVDQDYVFLKDKIVMAGSNEKGAAFYQYKFSDQVGELLEKDIKGQVELNLFEYLTESNTMESLWAVKVKGYSNSKQTKGEYIKDAFIIHAVFDTSGTMLNQKKIGQNQGKFPLDARLVRQANGDRVVFGSYQATNGDKGIYTFGLNYDTKIKTFPFTQMLKGNVSLNNADLQKLYASYTFLPVKPTLGRDGQILFGGVFFNAQYQTVTDNNNNFDPYGNNRFGDPFGRNRFGNNSRSRSRQVFLGYNYPTGFVAEFSADGELLKQNRIDLNHTSRQIQQPLSYNDQGSVAFCVKGDVATNNFNISNKPLLYKLSEERASQKDRSFIPSYEQVTHWYDNYFFAIGSRSKIEVVSVNDNQTVQTVKRKWFQKKQTPATFSQVRKVYYLTKIASGR